MHAQPKYRYYRQLREWGRRPAPWWAWALAIYLGGMAAGVALAIAALGGRP